MLTAALGSRVAATVTKILEVRKEASMISAALLRLSHSFHKVPLSPGIQEPKQACRERLPTGKSFTFRVTVWAG